MLTYPDQTLFLEFFDATSGTLLGDMRHHIEYYTSYSIAFSKCAIFLRPLQESDDAGPPIHIKIRDPLSSSQPYVELYYSRRGAAYQAELTVGSDADVAAGWRGPPIRFVVHSL